jgi:arsenate reductase-like glutaredoxin family protein
MSKAKYIIDSIDHSRSSTMGRAKDILSRFDDENNIKKILEDGISPSQISRLKKEWGSVGRIDVTSKEYKDLEALIDGLSDQQLKQLANADIKFISDMARIKSKK